MQKWQKFYLRFVAVTAIQAGIFVAYRLWMDKKNKQDFSGARVDPVALDLFKPEASRLLVELAFNKEFENEKLSNMQTKTAADNPEQPDNLDIQPLMYRRVLVSIQKYKETRRGLYGIYVDFAGLKTEQIMPSEFLEAFTKDAKLTHVPVVKSYADALDDDFVHYMLLKDLPEDREMTAEEYYAEAQRVVAAEASANETGWVGSPELDAAMALLDEPIDTTINLDKVPNETTQAAMTEARDMVATRFKEKEEEKASSVKTNVKKPLGRASSKLKTPAGTLENERPAAEVADLKTLQELSDVQGIDSLNDIDI